MIARIRQLWSPSAAEVARLRAEVAGQALLLRASYRRERSLWERLREMEDALRRSEIARKSSDAILEVVLEGGPIVVPTEMAKH